MKLELIDSTEFHKFANKNPQKSFYQTPEIAQLREKNGWTVYYFGLKNGTKVVAASLVVAKPTFLGKSVYYAPGGPLLDYEDESIVEAFFKNLKRYAKSHNGYVLHIEPYYEFIERDRHGELVEGGFNRQAAKQNLRRVGFIALPHADEPQYSFVLNLKNQSAEQIFASMKRNTRNHIRKAEKSGVQIRELTREELPIFKQITQSTSNRRNFNDKPLSYYEQMYDLFHEKGEVKFILAEANHKPLSAAMFMLYGDEIIYLFSGSDEKYMKEYNAQYLIQWYMIKYAVKNQFKRYNFYGINGLPNRTNSDYGIYDFKKGFTSEENGQVTELLGAYELPVNLVFYHLHQLLRKIKHHQKQ